VVERPEAVSNDGLTMADRIAQSSSAKSETVKRDVLRLNDASYGDHRWSPSDSGVDIITGLIVGEGMKQMRTWRTD